MPAEIARALAIEVDVGIVRGLVLVAGEPATVGGYAQVNLPSPRSAPAVAVRIAKALDVDTALAVVVVPGNEVAEVQVGASVAQLRSAGFAAVRIEQRADAVERVVDEQDAEPASLRNCMIPQGLLNSHDGLTLAALAPVAGAAVGLFDEAEVMPLVEAELDPAPTEPDAPTPAIDDVPTDDVPTGDTPAEASTVSPDAAGGNRWLIGIAALVVVALIAFAVSRCGSDDESSSAALSSAGPPSLLAVGYSFTVDHHVAGTGIAV